MRKPTRVSGRQQFFNDPDDVQWLKDTHLKGKKNIPLFRSFVLHGNEDAPEYVALYAAKEPNVNDDVVGELYDDRPGKPSRLRVERSRKSTLKDAKQVASQLGMTVKKTPHGEYRATFKGLSASEAEAVAAYETDADAIIGTMRAMALHGSGTAHRKPSIHEGHEVVGYDGQPYGVGDRVELHPGTDLWMKGARYGTVVSLSLTSADQVKVELDKMPNRLFSGPGERFKRID